MKTVPQAREGGEGDGGEKKNHAPAEKSQIANGAFFSILAWKKPTDRIPLSSLVLSEPTAPPCTKKISAPPAILSKNLWRCCECSIYPVVRTTLGVWTVQSQISALAKMLQAKKRCYYLSQLMGFRRSSAEDFLHMQFMALHKKPSNSTKGFAKSGEQLCFCKEDEIKRGSKSSFFGKTPLVSISSPSSSLFKASTHVIRYRQGPPLLQNGEGRVQASPRPHFPPIRPLDLFPPLLTQTGSRYEAATAQCA